MYASRCSMNRSSSCGSQPWRRNAAAVAGSTLVNGLGSAMVRRRRRRTSRRGFGDLGIPSSGGVSVGGLCGDGGPLDLYIQGPKQSVVALENVVTWLGQSPTQVAHGPTAQSLICFFYSFMSQKKLICFFCLALLS